MARARSLFGLQQRGEFLRRPRNVVLFVGDGMGLNTVAAARDLALMTSAIFLDFRPPPVTVTNAQLVNKDCWGFNPLS